MSDPAAVRPGTGAPWATIEAVADTRSAPARAAAPTAGGRERLAAPRLRRLERPVLGAIDAAGTVVQRNVRLVVLGSAVVILPSVALNLLFTTLTFDRFTELRGSVVSVPELFGDRTASSAENVLWYVGLALAGLVASIVGGYAAVVVSRPQIRSVRSAHRALLGRLPALIVAWIVGHAWLLLVALALAEVDAEAIGSLALVTGAFLAMLSALTACVAPAIVVEGLGPFRGLRRAWRLARTNFGVLFGFVIMSAFVGLFVQFGIAYLPRLLEGMSLIRFGRFGWLIEGVAGQLGRLISTPLVAVATVLIYLDLRMSGEGMDLVVEAERAFGATG